MISVYKDKSFTFVTKQPPAAALLKKAAGLASGSGTPNKKKVGTITKAQLMEVVKAKIADLNTNDEEAACRILAGTARQMGLEIEGYVNHSTQRPRPQDRPVPQPAGGRRRWRPPELQPRPCQRNEANATRGGELVDEDKIYPLDEACAIVGKFPAPKFDQSVTISFRIGVDPRKSDQMVRGTCPLPNGTGKEVRVLVFAEGECRRCRDGRRCRVRRLRRPDQEGRWWLPGLRRRCRHARRDV